MTRPCRGTPGQDSPGERPPLRAGSIRQKEPRGAAVEEDPRVDLYRPDQRPAGGCEGSIAARLRLDPEHDLLMEPTPRVAAEFVESLQFLSVLRQKALVYPLDVS